MYANILTEIDAGVGIVTLNQPDRHNSLDAAATAELTEAMRRMTGDEAVRLVVLSSVGESFCAGTDPAWMQRLAGLEENQGDASAQAKMLLAFSECPKPVIARVQGPAYGSGVGLVAACDMAVATFDAKFALTEVRLDLFPAVIAPYVVGAIGERYARRYLLTAELFSAAEAYRIGLIHEMVADAAALDEAIGEWVDAILRNAPQALAGCKALIRPVSNRPLGSKVVDYTVERSARGCISPKAAQVTEPPATRESGTQHEFPKVGAGGTAGFT